MTTGLKRSRLIRAISDPTWRAVQNLSARHGIFDHPRADRLSVTHRDGAKPKRGSVRGLLEHIASGECALVMIRDDDATASSMLDELQRALDDARERRLQYDMDAAQKPRQRKRQRK